MRMMKTRMVTTLETTMGAKSKFVTAFEYQKMLMFRLQSE